MPDPESDRRQNIERGLTELGFWRGRLPTCTLDSADWRALQNGACDLPRDSYASDAGRYRTLDRFIFEMNGDTARLDDVALTAYRQGKDYNPELGGVARHYPRSGLSLSRNQALGEILTSLTPVLCRIASATRLLINVHHVRYLATETRPARNSPSGLHKDGERFISVHLLSREGLAGGINRIADNRQQPLARFTLVNPGDCFVIDDDRVWHAVEEMHVAPGQSRGTRDILLIDYLPDPI